MTSSSQIGDSFLRQLVQQENALAAQARAQAQGTFQGRQVQARPHAQKIAPAPATQVSRPSVEPPVRGQRQARPASTAPALLRQARYAALHSVPQLAPSFETPGKTVQGKGLPSVDELGARMAAAKSPSLLERLLNLFRGEKPPDSYQKILTGLTAYHDACRNGNGHDPMLRLEELASIVNRHDAAGDGRRDRVEIIGELRAQIASERATLATVMEKLNACDLPEGACMSHALDFHRAGVPLESIAGLVERGLELDQAQEARELLDDPERFLRHEMLSALQRYHDTCGQSGSGDGNDTRLAQQSLTTLMQLDTATWAYFEGMPMDSVKEAVTDFRDQIPQEIMVLQGLLAELKQGGALPRGADLSHALAFAREGVSLKDMARLMDKGLLPSQAAEARALLDSERASHLLQHLNARSRAEIARSEFSANELVLLELSGLGLEGGQAYRRLGLPITHQTIVTAPTDDQRLGSMSRLGGGAFNEVYAARYSGPEGILNGVFKPLSNTENGWVAEKIGIDLDRPKIANRNLATLDVARALGFDVVVDCQIGSRRQASARTMQPLQIGLVMGRAPGQLAAYTPASHYAEPEVRREITKLQLLDHLAGQGDRHSSNYFIHVHQDETGQTKARVSGIDNDQCFGRNTLHGNGICHVANDRAREGFRGTRMPELIDTDMAAAIRGITPDRLAVLLSDKLSPQEVDAAQSRLQSMHAHVNELERKNQVITPAAWNAMTDMSAFHRPESSYVARDSAGTPGYFPY